MNKLLMFCSVSMYLYIKKDVGILHASSSSIRLAFTTIYNSVWALLSYIYY